MRNWKWWLGSVLTLLLVTALATSWRKAPPMAQVQLTPEVTLKLAAVLSHYNDKFSAESRVRQGYRKLPDGVRDLLPASLTPPINHYESSYVEPGSIKPVLLIDFPKSWKTRPGLEITRRLTSILTKGRQDVGIRVNYGDGLYSEISPLVVRVRGRALGGRKPLSEYAFVASDLVYNAPGHLQSLKLEFVDGKTTPPGVLYGLTVENPFYGKGTSLNAPPQLPVTAVHGDVAVSLEGLIPRANIGASNLLLENAVDHDSSPADIPLEPVDSGLTPGTVALFHVSDTSTNTVRWEVTKVSATYGTSHWPFRASLKQYPLATVFSEDMNLLRQPVRLSLKLRKSDGFGTDEQQTVELPLPPRGGDRSAAKDIAIGRRKVSVTVANSSKINPVGEHIPKPDYIAVLLSGHYETDPLSNEYLLFADGTTATLDRLPTTGPEPYSTYYDIPSELAEKLNNDAPCTISLSVTIPKTFPAQFTFTAVPARPN